MTKLDSRHRQVLLSIAGILIAGGVFQRAGAQTELNIGSCLPGEATKDLDINGVVARLYNNGGLYWKGGGAVYNVPAGSSSNAIFASGIWLGGTVDGQLRMVASTYGPWELWPGPLDEAGLPPSDCSAFDRMYKVSRSDLDALTNGGTASPDILDWPWQLGAPVEDGDGIPGNYNVEAGDRPLVEGHQTIWWVMNDLGNDHTWSRTPPIGLEVQVTAFAADSPIEAVYYTTYYRYRLTNKSNRDLEEAYFGLWADPDLGDASDDYVGSDTTVGVAYAWNGDDDDGGADGYGSKPPAIGYSVVEGFEADDDGLDNNADGQIDESGERMGMTRFMYYLNSSVNLGNPNDGDEAYDYLRGFWRDGMPLTLGGTGHGFSEIPVDFAFPGEPGKFWSEENIDAAGNRNPPGRRKFVLSFGPFTFPAGASKEVVLALTFARGDDRFASVRKLVESIDTVHAAYRDGFGLGFSPTAAESGPDQPPTTNHQPLQVGSGFPTVRLSEPVHNLRHNQLRIVGARRRGIGRLRRTGATRYFTCRETSEPWPARYLLERDRGRCATRRRHLYPSTGGKRGDTNEICRPGSMSREQNAAAGRMLSSLRSLDT